MVSANKQTNTVENITSSAEVIIMILREEQAWTRHGLSLS